jgi:hypothetical protein
MAGGPKKRTYTSIVTGKLISDNAAAIQKALRP